MADKQLRYGYVVPMGDSRHFAELAVTAEQAGWDAAFIAESVWGVDAWVAMTAAAVLTERIRVGTLLTPVPRIRPWDLASRAVTLDRLSNGRLILSAGLGALHDGWTAFERDEGRAMRVRKLDEGLAVYDGLMRGQPFAFDGEIYQVRPTTFYPPDPPVQRPRPPVWLVGAYVPGRIRQPSLERAARWDGLLPARTDATQGKVGTPARLQEVIERVRRYRENAGLPWEGYDVVLEADSTGGFVQLEPNDPDAWAEVGVTWWVESWWDVEDTPAGQSEIRRRIEAGPRGVVQR